MSKTVEQLIRESIGELGATEKVASNKLDQGEAHKISHGLMKLAELPYKEEAYESICEIMKIASSSLNSALSELNGAGEKINKLEKIAEIRQMIDEMIDIGMIGKEDIQEKTAEFANKSDREIEITKEALKMGAMSSQNIFFEKSAEDSSAPVKRGIFDGAM